MLGVRQGVVAAFCCASVVLVDGAGARAQTAGGTPPDPLAPARALFAEALRDQEAQRFSEALQKFQRVRAVRDTASIEYRIGACYEGLGQRPPAFAAYREATVLGQGDPQSADVVTAAGDRLQALGKRIGQVTLVMPPRPPGDVEIRIDDAPVSPTAAASPIPLEPGNHVVVVTATGAAPFRSEVALSEGAHASLPVSLVVLGSAPPSGGAPEEATVGPARTLGWITIAAGGALLATSTVLLVLQHDDVATLTSECPNGICKPGANEPYLSSTRSRALVEGPVGISLGIAGVAAAGVGAVLVLTSKSVRVVPLLAPDARGVAVAGVFP
jgi:hypothetical protein